MENEHEKALALSDNWLAELERRGLPWRKVACGLLTLLEWLFDLKNKPENFSHTAFESILYSSLGEEYSSVEIVGIIIERLNKGETDHNDIFDFILDSASKKHKYASMNDAELRATFEELIQLLKENVKKKRIIKKNLLPPFIASIFFFFAS